MANFSYIARNTTGDKVSGSLEAASEAAAVRLLDEKQLFPVRVDQLKEKRSEGSGNRVSVRELSGFFEQLSDLLRAGVPLMRALQTLSRTASGKRIRRVVDLIHEHVQSGQSLEEAMGKQPGIFNSLQIAMVRAGERGGFLENVLSDLAGYLERQDDLRSRVRGAMIYPVVLVAVGAIVVTGLLIGMVPKFKPIFEGTELPLPSRLLFAASDMVVEHWSTTLALGALSLIALALFMKSEAGARFRFAAQYRTPLIGYTMRMVSVTRFCRILGTMLVSGVPLLLALKIARDATGTPAMAESIDNAIESVQHGRGLTPPLKDSNLFPPQLLEMIAVAEESNQLEKVLLKIADTVEKRTNRQVDSVVRLLEPVILVFLAGTILFVAIGLLYPIFSMAQNLR